MLRSAETSVR